MKTLLMIISLILSMLISSCEMKNENLEVVIVEKEKLLLDEWGKGHTMVFPENSADEITYFDPSLQKRLKGKNNFIELLKPIENKFTIEKYEMIDPEVQIYGDVGILTYNLIDYSKDLQGTEKKFLWNTTEVYKKFNEEWLLVHSHWSITKPL